MNHIEQAVELSYTFNRDISTMANVKSVVIKPLLQYRKRLLAVAKACKMSGEQGLYEDFFADARIYRMHISAAISRLRLGAEVK